MHSTTEVGAVAGMGSHLLSIIAEIHKTMVLWISDISIYFQNPLKFQNTSQIVTLNLSGPISALVSKYWGPLGLL